MQNSSPGLQWSQFIANEHNCLLESGLSQDNYLAQDPIGLFDSFDELFDYLKSKSELLNLKDLGFTLLKSYEGKEYIQLYSEIQKLDEIEIKYPIDKIDGEIIYPDKESYKEAVRECQKYIYEGDIYQANLCHEFTVKPSINYSLKQIKNLVYSRLRKLNPTNYLAMADFGKWLVFSSSPESLLNISFDGDFILKSSPIKGTAGLNDSLEKLKNEKESAEHVMIVDLIRNDLGRIAKTGTVKVSELLNDTKHSNLQHLESDIIASLDEKNILRINGVEIPDFRKIFKAIFPGGSITGAPKIRSMQVIEELEDKKRGLFTGSLGFYKFKEKQGAFNILIRSIFYNKETGDLSFNTGAGITSSSDPEKEYQETLLKAEKLIEVFQ